MMISALQPMPFLSSPCPSGISTRVGYSLRSGFIHLRSLSGIGAIFEIVPLKTRSGSASHLTRTGIPVEIDLRFASWMLILAENASAVGRIMSSCRSQTSCPSCSGSRPMREEAYTTCPPRGARIVALSIWFVILS